MSRSNDSLPFAAEFLPALLLFSSSASRAMLRHRKEVRIHNHEIFTKIRYIDDLAYKCGMVTPSGDDQEPPDAFRRAWRS